MDMRQQYETWQFMMTDSWQRYDDDVVVVVVVVVLHLQY